MDKPTEQLRAMDMSARDVPRTDEELGLDPDVPTVDNRPPAAGSAKSAELAEPGADTAEPGPGKPGLRTQDSATATAAASDPAVTGEVVTESAASDTAASDKAVSDEAVAESAVSDKAATEPAVSDKADTEPAGSELDADTEPGVEAETDRGSETAAYAYASIPPATNAPGERSKAARRRTAENRRGTLDLGLLLLRLVVGAVFLYHGLQKLTGWFHGPGLDGARDMMVEGGWEHPTLSTILLVVGEVGGGALLILGLATPLAAGAVLAVILNAWAWKQGMLPGFQFNSSVPTGVEIDTILAGTAVAIILTGPGRLSLDRSRGWATRPFLGSFAALLLAVLAAGLTFWYLHGGNPLTGIGPFD